MTKSAPSAPTNLDWRKILFVAVLIGIVGYQWYTGQQNQPANNDANAGINENVVDVPDKIDLDLDKGNLSATSDSDKANKNRPPKSQPFLSAGPNGSKVSPAGLIYTQTRHGEHRTTHVLRHAKDMPNRQGSHGVFENQTNDDVFRLIDEAYELIQAKSKQVKAEPEKDGKRAFVIDMKRTIGFKGGQSGKRAGHPKLKKIKLILADNRVITAYPY